MIDVFASSAFLKHDTGAHPECADRLRQVLKDLRELEPEGWQWQAPRGQPAAAEIDRVHDAAYRQKVEQFAASGGGRIESDTVVSPNSYNVATLAASTSIEAVDRVMSKKVDQALCLIRPPGHHALQAGAMGFCLFNNVAVAARYAQAKYDIRKILVVDWDVHHGNGTQNAFFDDPDIYFFSSHRYPFYPGTGTRDETGTGQGIGTTFNLPCKFSIERKEFLSKFESMLNDAAAKCQPELILLSAGFDAHQRDPIGSLRLETEDFGDLTRYVHEIASTHCQGKLVSLMEGGYDPRALSESIQLHLKTLVELNEC